MKALFAVLFILLLGFAPTTNQEPAMKHQLTKQRSMVLATIALASGVRLADTVTGAASGPGGALSLPTPPPLTVSNSVDLDNYRGDNDGLLVELASLVDAEDALSSPSIGYPRSHDHEVTDADGNCYRLRFIEYSPHKLSKKIFTHRVKGHFWDTVYKWRSVFGAINITKC